MAPCPAANIQDAPAREFQRLLFMRGEIRKSGQVPAEVLRVTVAIIPLNVQCCTPCFVKSAQCLGEEIHNKSLIPFCVAAKGPRQASRMRSKLIPGDLPQHDFRRTKEPDARCAHSFHSDPTGYIQGQTVDL